jgi:hypothetical protein
VILRHVERGRSTYALFDGNCGFWDSLEKYYTTNVPGVLSGYSNQNNPTHNKYNFPNAGAAMIEPTVINGMVYVGSDSAVTVFGL